MFKKDDFRTFIVIVVVCVVCLTIGLFFGFKTNTDKLVAVNEYNIFFSNVNYINNYISLIANGNNGIIYELFDDKYIKNNDITESDNIDGEYDYTDFSVFEASSMYNVKVKDDNLYYINGIVYDVYHDDKEIVNDNFSMLIIEDVSTNSYSLYPVNDNNYSKIINSIWRVNIENNKYNDIMKSETINKEQVCVIYLSDFLSTTFGDIDKSYDILSDNMKKLYTNNTYENFVMNNFNLMSSTADKCKMEEIEDKRVYTVIDSNGNTYIFNEDSVMNYKVDFYLKEVE